VNSVYLNCRALELLQQTFSILRTQASCQPIASDLILPKTTPMYKSNKNLYFSTSVSIAVAILDMKGMSGPSQIIATVNFKILSDLFLSIF